MRRRIFYVEDDSVVREKYARMLKSEGFEVVSFTCKGEALISLRKEIPDLVLLDISEEGEHDAGYRLCAAIRRLSDEVPVIFLTNRQSEIDKVSGFRLGADDYISKDASTEYIVVRIEALLGRVDAIRGIGNKETTTPSVKNSLELDEVYCLVHWHGQHIDMPLTQFRILRELCLNPGSARSHHDLMKAANLMVATNTIAAHVKSIRQAFYSQDPEFHCIRTERGRGYRWIAE